MKVIGTCLCESWSGKDGHGCALGRVKKPAMFKIAAVYLPFSIVLSAEPEALNPAAVNPLFVGMIQHGSGFWIMV